MTLLAWAWVLTLPGLVLTAAGVGRRPGVASVPGPLLVGLAGLIWMFGGRTPAEVRIWNWLPFLPDGSLYLRLDGLSATMLAVVGLVSFCIYVYSLAYMEVRDETADGWQAALDLIIESEHGADSSAFLVTPSRDVAEAAVAALPQHWARMGDQRRGYSQAVLGGERGGVLLTPDIESAYAFVNDYAPEHLLILGRDPFAHMSQIRNAGEILLGSHTPFTLGNFVLGPNAVLPTAGAARTVSALSVHDFMKRSGVGYVTAAGYPLLAPAAETLARYEGFEGHANAVSDWRQRKT